MSIATAPSVVRESVTAAVDEIEVRRLRNQIGRMERVAEENREKAESLRIAARDNLPG
ncbi:hypothetical protein JNW90_28625 [Micromonospora sp. STR1s_5]|nr:hypothetical protein [Micromonospora sp. STR1s_5]